MGVIIRIECGEWYVFAEDWLPFLREVLIKVEELYVELVRNNAPALISDWRSREMANKLTLKSKNLFLKTLSLTEVA